ncbi:MAG: CDP-diacylglycerol--serine O-phosphatidyltransferase [Bacteroidia bacterium]|nr:CDP-diacylglycerol--serine O-phosphatidyltransferase [Bacteroidia bacterium]
MNPLKHIPNFITSLNVLAGCLSIVASVEGFPVLAAFFILAAAVLDFFDGFFARLLKAYSDIGKELDSLADVISFGVAPAFIIYNLLKSVLIINEISFETVSIEDGLLLISPFLLVIFSALRLAKFNVDTRQTSSFIGLPTPANAILIASLPMVMAYTGSMKYFFIFLNLKFLIPLIFIQCFLLVSPIPMFALKFKNFALKENLVRYIFIILVIVLIIAFKIVAMPLIIVLYVILSIINAIVCKFFCKKHKTGTV